MALLWWRRHPCQREGQASMQHLEGQASMQHFPHQREGQTSMQHLPHGGSKAKPHQQRSQRPNPQFWKLRVQFLRIRDPRQSPLQHRLLYHQRRHARHHLCHPACQWRLHHQKWCPPQVGHGCFRSRVGAQHHQHRPQALRPRCHGLQGAMTVSPFSPFHRRWSHCQRGT